MNNTFACSAVAFALVGVCGAAAAQDEPPGPPAAAAATSVLRVQLRVENTQGERVPLRVTRVHISRVEPDPSTNGDGVLTIRLPVGDYTLDVAAATRCHASFKVVRGKQLSLFLLVPTQGGACENYVPAPTDGATLKTPGAASGAPPKS